MTDELRAAGERLTRRCETYRDLLLLARAYLASNPADSDTPVTREWLLGCGFTEAAEDAGDEPGWFRWKGVSFHLPTCKVYLWDTGVNPRKTRDEFRALFKGLGIELKESTQ